jgi:Tfp pilus assembly protein PilF
MIDYRMQIENALKGFSATVINTGLNGAYIRGTAVKTLEEVMATVLPARGNVAASLAEMEWKSRISATEMTIVFERIREKCTTFSRACQQGEALVNVLQELIAADPDGKEVVEQHSRVQRYCERFESEHDLMVRITECSRLDDIRSLAQRREKLPVGKGIRNERETLSEEASISSAYFRSQQHALTRWYEYLEQMDSYFRKINGLVAGRTDDANGPERLLEVARSQMGCRQLWLAEKYYQQYLDTAPQQIEAWLELVDGYRHFRLWNLAKYFLRHALELHPQNRQLLELNDKNNHSIFLLLTEAKAAWHEAFNHLVEYIAINPQDPVAQKLHHSIKALAPDNWLKTAQPEKVADSNEEDERLLARAREFIRDGEPERAAGILEGLAQRYDGRDAGYREKLGDFRYLQQQFASAAWHYSRAAQANPAEGEISIKAAKAREMARTDTANNAKDG